MAWQYIIPAAAAVYGATMNNNAQKKQLELSKEAMDRLANVPLPELKELDPELYKQVVSINPELEHAENLGPSAMEGIALDPRLRQAQLNALMKLQQISEADGKDAQFLSDSARLQNDINSNLRGNTEAIQQNLASRGMSGGMSEMVSRNQAAQEAANRQAQMGLDINAQAQQRALQALMNGANVGSQIEQQDFNRQSQVAQAQDAINKFNTVNRQQVQNNNLNRRNDAQSWNAQNTQNTANQNTSLKNNAEQYNAGLSQQQYNNQIARAGGQAQGLRHQGDLIAQNNATNMGFLGNVINAGATAYASSSRRKKDEEE